MIFEIDDICIEVLKKTIKNVNLRIYPPEGQVKMSVPLWYSEKQIKKFLQEKITWIHTQRQRLRHTSPLVRTPASSQTTLAFKGVHYPIVYQETQGTSQIFLKNKFIYCLYHKHTTEIQKQLVLDSWYKKEMQNLLPDLIAHWEKIIEVQVVTWGIRKMKTRWGSCNPKAKRIWLNLTLIQKPLICLEYVLVHELIHLLEPSHNKRFYDLMTKYMPNWQEHKELLERF